MCGGILDNAHYPRKPKGLPQAFLNLLGFKKRISFCCRDCRKRHTPMSVIFLERRVYLSIVIVLACVLAQGLRTLSEQKLEDMGIPRQTLHNWLKWWSGEFQNTSTWKTLSAYFARIKKIPLDPLQALEGDSLSEKLIKWLNNIIPLSVSSSMFMRVGGFTQKI